MHGWRPRWRGLFGVALALGGSGCPDKGGEEGDASTSEASAATLASEGTTASTDTTATAADTAETETGTPVTCEGLPDYSATAEVLDEGLGPTGAPVTIANCSGETAYVFQDCCYGATNRLERKDAVDDPWRTSMPSFECDCAGPIDPLVVEPGSSIVVDTNPSQYDSEPLCEDPYVAIYRWTFLVGPEPDCAECWQTVPTNEFSWYCEG